MTNSFKQNQRKQVIVKLTNKHHITFPPNRIKKIQCFKLFFNDFFFGESTYFSHILLGLCIIQDIARSPNFRTNNNLQSRTTTQPRNVHFCSPLSHMHNNDFMIKCLRLVIFGKQTTERVVVTCTSVSCRTAWKQGQRSQQRYFRVKRILYRVVTRVELLLDVFVAL
jgi:hypothetical protein